MESRMTKLVAIAITMLATAAPGRAAPRSGAALDTAQIEQLTGAKGQLDDKEGVFKVSVPRDDLQPTVAGVKLPTSMGLTAWAAFQGSPAHTMVMGDLVLAEDQVNPVMSVALDSGLEVTALHNHFFWESPRVMFMHIGGMGDEKALASAVGKVFAKVKETAGGKGEKPPAGIDPSASTLDTSRIDAALGLKGKADHGVYKVTTRLATRHASSFITFTFRLMEPMPEAKLVFSPLLSRFLAGVDPASRPVKVSDSGRLRNELQTMFSQALEHDGDKIRVHFDRVDEKVMPRDKQAAIRRVLEWYKANHPVWFGWLEVA
jgi:hypothetical protein